MQTRCCLKAIDTFRFERDVKVDTSRFLKSAQSAR